MSLLDGIKKEQAQATPVEGAAVQEAVAEAPAAKKSNSEYQKKQRELRNAHAKTMRDWAASEEGAKVVKKFSKEVKEAFEFLTKEPKAGGAVSAFGKPIIYQLFGDAPKVGGRIEALEVYKRTGKGFPEMKKAIKKWAEKGVIVAYDEKTESYVIKEGTIAAYAA